MKWLLIVVFSIITAFQAHSQKQYYFYFEAENGQPFYIKNGDKIISSHNNYIIFSGLIDSTYQLAIGFSGNPTPESRFRLPVNGKDHGFQVKMEEGNYTLYDLESHLELKSTNIREKSTVQYQRLNDPFSLLLSRAANDSSLLMVPVANNTEIVEKKKALPVEENHSVKNVLDSNSIKAAIENKTAMVETKSSTVLTPPVVEKDVRKDSIESDKKLKDPVVEMKAAVKDTSMQVKTEPDPKIVKSDENKIVAQPTPEPATVNVQNHKEESIYKRTKVKKHAESSTSEGFGLVYFDFTEKGIDTIRLVIPNPKINLVKSDNNAPAPAEPVKTTDSLNGKSKTSVVKRNPAIASCKNLASDNDFYKLRKNMAPKTTDEAMLNEAIKAFKSKCFTSAQVRNLSTFFLSDAGKYALFDAAYLHVSDKENFKALSVEINDPYYLKRFLALTGDN